MNRDTGVEVKTYKLKALPLRPIPSAVLYIKGDTDTEVTPYITDVNGVPYPLNGAGGAQNISNTDGTIIITGTTNTVINLSTAIKNLINSALQSGDNISELNNDSGYITIADVPPTNLQSIPSPTNVVIGNDNGSSATIFPATTTNAGVLLPGDKVKLDNTTNINSGDQNSIVGISGTKAQYNTSLTDGDFLFVGDATVYTDEEAQDAVGSILVDTSTIDLTYNDVTPSISASVNPNSITSTELANNINISEFINDSNFETTNNKTDIVIGNESSTSLYLNILGAWTYFQQKLTDVILGTFLFGLTSKTTPLDVDGIVIFDTADSNKSKKVTFTNLKAFLKTYFDTLYNIPQITITTAVSITTATTDVSGNGQKGRNVIISNGASAINLTVNGGTDFVSSYVKHGTGAITFVQGSGRTLIQVDGTAVLNGLVGSTATISSVSTTDYLRISNA